MVKPEIFSCKLASLKISGKFTRKSFVSIKTTSCKNVIKMNSLTGNTEKPDQQCIWLLLRQIISKSIYYSNDFQQMLLIWAIITFILYFKRLHLVCKNIWFVKEARLRNTENMNLRPPWCCLFSVLQYILVETEKNIRARKL